MKILLLNPNFITRHNWGHQLFKNEFGRQHDVTYYGQGFPNYYKNVTIPKLLLKMKRKYKKEFDLIITFESKWSRDFKGLGDVNIPKAHVICDYVKPRKGFNGFAVWPTIDKLLKEVKYDIIFSRSVRDVEDLKRNLDFEKVFFLPFSVDTKLYYDMNLNRNIDVMASFTNRPDVYPMRRKIQNLIQKMPVKSFTKRVLHNEYIKKINSSKIFANSGSAYPRLTMKFTEVLACKTLLLTEKPEDMEDVGFKNGKHFVVYEGLVDLKQKINYYLKNEKERNKIALKGMRFVHAHHNNKIRVKQFIDIVKDQIL